MQKQIETDCWLKPIPIRKFDWQATYKDYEEGDDIGYGETEQESIKDLLSYGDEK